MKRLIINLVKFSISAALLSYLIYTARESLSELPSAEKDWGLLSLATLLCFGGVTLTILRWYLLVRALEMPFRLRDAFRLGFLSYMLNFFSLGAVGGDLFKAVFLAREQPGRRPEAVATVVVDRMIGLYALLVVASIAILATGLRSSAVPEIQTTCDVTLICTAVGGLFVLMVLTPGFTNGAFSELLGRLPYVGQVISKLLSAVRMYRSKKWTLLVVSLMSLGVHATFSLAFYCIARGLPGQAPDLAAHFVIVPLGMLAGALPLPLSGLGATEAVLEFLYLHYPGAVGVTQGTGLFVSLTYRVITIIIAIVGYIYYLTNRAMVARLMRESEALQDGEELPATRDAEPSPAAEEIPARAN